MRTTVRLDDALLERARKEAVRRRTTLTALIEQGLQSVLCAAKQPPRRPVHLPISHQGGGVVPGVDINNSAELLERMERAE